MAGDEVVDFYNKPQASVSDTLPPTAVIGSATQIKLALKWQQACNHRQLILYQAMFLLKLLTMLMTA